LYLPKDEVTCRTNKENIPPTIPAQVEKLARRNRVASLTQQGKWTSCTRRYNGSSGKRTTIFENSYAILAHTSHIPFKSLE
jgi:hypothetical protein